MQPEIFILVAVALIILGFLWPQRKNSHSQELAEWAQKNNWSYTESAPNLARLFTEYPFSADASGTARHVLFGRYRDRLVITYDYHPSAAESAPKKGASNAPALRVVAVVIRQNTPQLQVLNRRFKRRSSDTRHADGFPTTLDERFDGAFEAVCDDLEFTHTVLTPEVMEYLLGTEKRYSFQLSQGYALTWSRDGKGIEESLKDAGVLIDLMNLLPDHYEPSSVTARLRVDMTPVEHMIDMRDHVS